MTKFNARHITQSTSEMEKISYILSLSYVSSGVVGFVKSVRNPSFSGGTEALNCVKRNWICRFFRKLSHMRQAKIVLLTLDCRYNKELMKKI